MGMPGGMPFIMNQGRGPGMMPIPMQPGMQMGQPMMPQGPMNMAGGQMGPDNSSISMHLCQEHFPEPIMMHSRDKPLCKKCIAEQFIAVQKQAGKGNADASIADAKLPGN